MASSQGELGIRGPSKPSPREEGNLKKIIAFNSGKITSLELFISYQSGGGTWYSPRRPIDGLLYTSASQLCQSCRKQLITTAGAPRTQAPTASETPEIEASLQGVLERRRLKAGSLAKCCNQMPRVWRVVDSGQDWFPQSWGQAARVWWQRQDGLSLSQAAQGSEPYMRLPSRLLFGLQDGV